MMPAIRSECGRTLAVEQVGDQVAIVASAPPQGGMPGTCVAMLVPASLAQQLAELLTGQATIAEEFAHGAAVRTDTLRTWAAGARPGLPVRPVVL